jgi:hypothetical protein
MASSTERSRSKSPSKYHSSCGPNATPSFLLLGSNHVDAANNNHSSLSRRRGEVNAADNHIAFSDLDPTFGNDEVADRLIELERGIVARKVTERLTVKDAEVRTKRLQELKSRLTSKRKKVPIRSEEEVQGYIQNMIVKGEQKKKVKINKVEKEMYPEQKVSISRKSEELARSYRERQEKKRYVQERLFQQTLKKLQRDERKKEEISRNRRASGLENLYRHEENNTSEIILKRHDGHAFRPAGSVERCRDLFLSTLAAEHSTTHEQPKISNSSEQERMQRFIELSQPREHQKSQKRVYQKS